MKHLNFLTIKKYSFLFLLAFPLLISAQGNDWGIGILSFANIQDAGMSIYNGPHGEVIGNLAMQKSSNNSDAVEINWRNEQGISMIIPKDALMEIGYEVNGMIVFEEVDGYICILNKGEHWVSIEELKAEGYMYTSWIDFMSAAGRWFMPIFYSMNVRTDPSASASLVVTVTGENFEIEPTGKSEGLWAEVIIKKYDSDYCEEPHNLIDTYKGWMKMVDDSGYPNVWFYTRGC